MQDRTHNYAILLSIAVVILVIPSFLLNSTPSDGKYDTSSLARPRRSFSPPPELTASKPFIVDGTDHYIYDSSHDLKTIKEKPHKRDCRMDNCFNYTQCTGPFKVYLYPESDQQPSSYYRKLLESIRRSKYITDNPSLACLFITSLDTLDRDKLSERFAQNLQEKLLQLPYWNNGRNHLIFNLYSGTWPDYSEHLDIDIEYAMLAKASISTNHFRAAFDISLPLFHETLPQRDGQPGQLLHLNIPSLSKYTLAFKGKRYLTGIGSESRNMLHHIHNRKDFIMLTTCKHGKGWEKYADERCAEDNESYDKYDYQDLLANSTFCLVPRGRRLGSFRFLEVLQYGCVPVLLSNNWELPFSEVIDWSQAVLWADESLIFQLPYVINQVSLTKVLALQQQSQFLWENYFSSIDKIVFTAMEIVRDRVQLANAHSISMWNTHPGVHALQPSFSKDLTQYPFFTQTNERTKFTAIVFITSRNKQVRRLIDTIASAQDLAAMFIFAVTGDESIVNYLKHVSSYVARVPIEVQSVTNMIDAYRMYDSYPTDAVFVTHQYDTLVTDEIDFAFSAWKEMPDRLVGYQSRLHLWHEGHQRYHFSSKVANQYSIILPDVAVFHKYYAQQFFAVSSSWREQDSVQYCSGLLLNFIISSINKKPPVKLAQHTIYSGQTTPSQAVWQELKLSDGCMETFSQKFGYMPLLSSQVRLDPTLYKDQVSKLRKRYPKLES